MQKTLIYGLLIALSISLGFNYYSLSQVPECRKQEPILYPNPALTPGDVFAHITEQDVCTPGYAKSVRKVPKKVREYVFRAYGVPYPPLRGAYELDHFIPLELGGSNDAKNLWPSPAEPRPGFHEKDTVENELHDMVCDGKVALKEAQDRIKKDWYAVYKSTAQ